MNKLIVLALSALMSFGAYAGNVRKSPNRSNNWAQRVSVQQAQSNQSWIEAAKSTAGVQFRSSVVNDLNFESINLPYFKDSVAFTTENGAQIAGAQRVKCYQFTVDKDTAIYVAAYNVNEMWGATFKISDEPFQSNYTPDDTLYNSNPVKVNISAGTHYVAFGDNNYYRTNFFASWLSISFKDEPVTAAAPVIRNSLYKEISLPYRNDSLAFTAENGAIKTQTGSSTFSNVLRYKISVPKDTSLYFQGYNSEYSKGVYMKISNSDIISSGIWGGMLTSEGATVDLPAGTLYIDLSDDGFSGDEFFVTAFSIRAKGDTLKDVKSPVACPATPNGAITFKEISLPFNDSIFFNKANGVVYNGYEKLLGFKVTVPQDTAIIYAGSSKYGWVPVLYTSNTEFDASLYGLTDYWPGDKINLKAGVNYIAFSDDGFDEDAFYRAKVYIKLTKPDPVTPVTPITFKEVSLPYRNDNLAFTEENGAVYNGYEKLLGFKITVAKDTTLYFQGYNNEYGWSPHIYYSKTEFDNTLAGTNDYWPDGNISLTAGTWYIALGDAGFDYADYYVTAFAISAENESQSLVSPTAPEKPAVSLTFKEISLPYSGDIEFSEESGSVEGPYGFVYNCYKFTVASKGTYKFVGDNNDLIRFVLSQTEFDSNFGGGSIPPFFGQQVTELEPGTYYMAIGNYDGMDMQFSISLTDDIKEVTLPYYHDGTEFTEKVSGLAPFDIYYDMYTFTLTEDKDVYIYGGNVPAGNEFAVAISDSIFTLSDLIISAPWVNVYPDSDPVKVSLTAGKYYVMILDNGYASQNGFSKYVAAVSFSYTDSVAQDKSSLYEPIPYTEITLPYTKTLEFTKENTVKGVSPGGGNAQLLGLKFTVDKDTTIYLQSKDTEHWGVSACIDSCMITVDSIMAAPSHLKYLGYEFMNDKLPVSLKAGTYYIVLSDHGFIEDNPGYSYYSTVFSITFDENLDYLSVEEISKVGVEEGEADAVKAYGRRGSIIVSGAGDAEVKVFGANGAPIYSGNGDAVIPALPGIYAVRVADKAFKVVVR